MISIIATGIVTSQIDPTQNNYQPNSLARLYLAAYLDQKNDYAKYLIAESFIDAELIDDGVATLSLVSHDSPWFIEARMSMVTALRSEESNKALALKIVNDLLDDYPDNPLIWAEKGLTAQRNLLHAEAEEAFMKAIELGLDNGRIQYYLAITQADQGKTDMAEASFRRSIELAPFNAYSLIISGTGLLNRTVILTKQRRSFKSC